jgi:hypothetical protein
MILNRENFSNEYNYFKVNPIRDSLGIKENSNVVKNVCRKEDDSRWVVKHINLQFDPREK